MQLEFPKERELSSVSVYWFDDTGSGECRVPSSWSLLVRDGEEWEPVNADEKPQGVKDQWNQLRFDPVTTTAVRIQVTLQPEFFWRRIGVEGRT